MSLRASAEGVKHSEGPQVLQFQHRFRSGALCKVVVDLEQIRNNMFTPHFEWNGRSCKRRELVQWIVGVSGCVHACGRASGLLFAVEKWGDGNVAF